MIDEEAAVCAARACASNRSSFHWREDRVVAERSTIEGTDCWIVKTEEPLQVGEEDWMRYLGDHEFSYFISAETGLFMGFRAGRYFEWFPTPRAPDEPWLQQTPTNRHP